MTTFLECAPMGSIKKGEPPLEGDPPSFYK
jgi:hypothetical protein